MSYLEEITTQAKNLGSHQGFFSNLFTIISNFVLFFSLKFSDTTIPVSIYEFESKIIEVFDDSRNFLLDMFGILLSNCDDTQIIESYKKIYLGKGIKLIIHRKYIRKIITRGGEITLSRFVLRPKSKNDLNLLISLTGKKTVVPLDEWLSISKIKYKLTPLAMIHVAYCAAEELSYNAAMKRLSMDSKINISDETVRAVTDYIGNLIYQNDLNIAKKLFDEFNTCKLNFKNNLDGIIYIMPDGSMIHTREKEETGRKWRENKLAVVFTSDNMVLTGEKDGLPDYLIKKKEYVTFFGSVDIFKIMLFATAIRNGYGDYKKTVLISDGATWIANMKDHLFHDAIHILDFWHLCEYVYEFAKIFFKNNNDDIKKWVDSTKKYFLDSKYLDVIIDIEEKEKNLLSNKVCYFNQNGENYKVGKLSKYIRCHINNIDYKSYRAQGLYIGSGHIESGNKSVAQERLKRPGMMWNVESAQHLLTLRTKLKSDLWESDVVKVVLDYFNKN
jgi:hypothetical protein